MLNCGPIRHFFNQLKDFRQASGVLEIHPRFLLQTQSLSNVLEAVYIDTVTWRLNFLEPRERRIDLSLDSLRMAIREIDRGSEMGKVRIIDNLDVFLSAVEFKDRVTFWRWALEFFRPQHVSIFLMVRSAVEIFPPDERIKWMNANRLHQTIGEDDSAYPA